jgi:hypothetical protein
MARGKVEEPVDDGITIGTATEEPELFPNEGPTIIQEWVEENAELFTRESLERSRESLHSKLSQIYAVVGRIAKTGTAPKEIGGFSFVEAANVAEVIRAELATRRITFMPIDMTLENVRTTKNGTPIETWKVTWMFVDGETGETHTVMSVGSGADTLDKAAPKAQTNAMKYALLMAFLIPTGDDPERFTIPEETGSGPINITASNIPGIKPGGRQGEITAAQFEAIRSRAKELQLDPLGMKQVVEHAMKELSADGKSYEIEGWPAGGTIDEQRDAILTFLSRCTFDDAAAILAELHGEDVE